MSKKKGTNGTPDENEIGGYAAGSRTQRPHSPTGWTHKRDTSPPAETQAKPGGYFATGRKKD